ncbi:MAG: hypothetical protein BWY31_00249 [Lentisphaerae bacterium ADurb.Bin242]|nr:MAG: hypothetical protein BWY31_00249 [Lentisphaerae bacterium ADurb.Bin242]
METARPTFGILPGDIFVNLLLITPLLGFLCGIGFYFYVIWSSKNSRLTRVLYTLLFPALFVLIVLPPLYSVKTGYRHNANGLGLTKLRLAISRSSNDPAESAELLKILREWRKNEDRDYRDLWNTLHNRYQDKMSRVQMFPEEIELKLPPDETPGCLPIIKAPPIKPGPEVDYSMVNGFAERVDERKQRMAEPYWRGKGILVTGKLNVEGMKNVKRVAAKTSFVTEDGVFAQSVCIGKTLRFVQHGYEPLDIHLAPERFRGIRSFDVGNIVLRKASPEHLSQISFTVELPRGIKNALVTLRNGNLPSCSNDDGHECAAPTRVVMEQFRVEPGKKTVITGLSRIPYELEFTANNCVRRTKYFNGGIRSIDFGTVALAEAKEAVFRVLNLKDKKPEWKKSKILIDGGNQSELNLTTYHIGSNAYWYRIYLQPDPKSEKIFGEFHWAPTIFTDYGRIQDGTTLRPEALPQPIGKFRQNVFLEPDHLYRLESDSFQLDLLIEMLPTSERQPLMK